MNVIAVTEKTKTTFRNVLEVMFIGNRWSWAFMLLGQAVAYAFLNLLWSWSWLGETVQRPFYMAMYGSTVAVLLIQAFVLWIRKRREKKSIKDAIKQEMQCLPNDLATFKWWLVDTFGDVVFAWFGAFVVMFMGMFV